MRIGGGYNVLRPLGLVLTVLVICTQVLVVYNFRNKVASKTAAHLKTAQNEESAVEAFDEDDFEEEVAHPLEEMVKKFPDHPDMVIKKLTKQIRSEHSRTKEIEDELSHLKSILGFSHESDKHEKSRKKRSATADRVAVEKCPENPPGLLGQIYVYQDFPKLEPNSMDFLDWYGPDVKPGGVWRPRHCQARQKVVILVPYRDRSWQLSIFLHHLHPVLQRQQLDYRIMVVEQSSDEDFNRAALMNVGYVETVKNFGHYDCLVFHDVDLLPEDDRNAYTCPSGSRAKHISVAVDKWKYRLQYREYFGGVTAMRSDLFKTINGFSNLFYGWGGEDDDLFNRIRDHNITVFRQPASIAKFKMLHHEKVEVNENLEKMMSVSKKGGGSKIDGLTSLKYHLLALEERPLYTRLLVKLPKDKTPKPKKSWWDVMGDSLQKGADKLVGKFAQGLTDKVLEQTVGKDEDLRKGNEIYL